MIPLIVSTTVAVLASSEMLQECSAAPSAPALSHVVLVVNDLERASARFRDLGFRLKQGRLHANNLLNRHVKFRDGSGLELMTVRGPAGDDLARQYAELAANGEGGVYVALDVLVAERVESGAATLQLESRRSSSGSWQFVSFPDSSPAAAVFFASGVPAVHDADSLVSHQPDVTGLAEAWLEGGSDLVALLEGLGAKRCGPAHAPSGIAGERIALSRGSVVVVPPERDSRPRVLGVVLRLRSSAAGTVWPHDSFWVRYEFGPK